MARAWLVIDLVRNAQMAEDRRKWLKAAKLYSLAIKEYNEADDPFGAEQDADDAYEGYRLCVKRLNWFQRLRLKWYKFRLNSNRSGY